MRPRLHAIYDNGAIIPMHAPTHPTEWEVLDAVPLLENKHGAKLLHFVRVPALDDAEPPPEVKQ